MSQVLEQLERLTQLRAAGALSEDEFQSEKSRILSRRNSEASSSFPERQLASKWLQPRADWPSSGRGKLLAFTGLGALVIMIGAWLWFSPLWALSKIQSALDERNADALSEYISYPELRANLKVRAMEQAIDDARRQPDNEFATLQTAMIGPLIDGMVSPDGLRSVFALKDVDGRDFGLISNTAGPAVIRRIGIGSLEVRRSGGATLKLALNGFGWKIIDLDDSELKRKRASNKRTGKTDGNEPLLPQINEPVINIDDKTEKLSTAPTRDWLVGGWQLSDGDCASDGGLMYNANGKYSDAQYIGEWTFERDLIVEKPQIRYGFDEQDVVLRTQPTKTWEIRRVSENIMSRNSVSGFREKLKRCPDANVSWLN